MKFLSLRGLLQVANVFDALTSHRPYKQARSVPFALLELEKNGCGGKIDPHCVNTLRYNRDYLKEVIEKYLNPIQVRHQIPSIPDSDETDIGKRVAINK
ncbi:hypothetical protein P4S72_24635 [Vibrio sp. PP-XX7]